MRWIWFTKTAIVVQYAVARTVQNAIHNLSAKDIVSEDELNLVAVDIYLDVPGQVHNGMYEQIADDLYIRDLPWVNVYFSLKRLPQYKAAGNVVRWKFRGYQCRLNEENDDRVCEEIVNAKLESDRRQNHSFRSQVPHIVARQSSLSSNDRRLQFEMPSNIAK
ncbi:hypothetical protein Plhal304r1_c093g0172821 [Plasmopara halstedii]